jgi:hypothetical protein
MDNNGFQFYPGKRLPVVCRDGVIRQAVATGYAAQFLSAAVQVSVAGKRQTVSGLVFRDNVPPGFVFMATGRNRDLIPWTKHKPRLAKLALRLIKATAYGRGAPGYVWDFPSDHSAALAGGCRHYYGTSEWPEGGYQARAVLRRLPADVLPRLARYFDKLERLQLTPPPPPPIE